MNEKRLRQIEKRIDKIKDALSKIGPMRPGSLTCQYKDPKEKSGPYWQIPGGHPKSPTCGHLKIPHLPINRLSKS